VHGSRLATLRAEVPKGKKAGTRRPCRGTRERQLQHSVIRRGGAGHCAPLLQAGSTWRRLRISKDSLTERRRRIWDSFAVRAIPPRPESRGFPRSLMRIHASALTLLAWLRQRESASVREIASSGLMSSREASDVVQYAMRYGALERITSVPVTRGSTRYRSTGAPLPELRSVFASPSFDGLLSAWGITQHPPELPVVRRHVYQIADNG